MRDNLGRFIKGSKSRLGKKHSQETKNKLRIANLGKKQSPELIEKRISRIRGRKRPDVSLRLSGNAYGKNRIPWNKGKKCPYLIGNTNGFKKGQPAWNKGRCIRNKPIILGEDKIYSPYWKQIRKLVYQRDKWICQECGVHCSNNISAHHIDYDTNNNDMSNLITLCRNCHMKTNFNRVNWIVYFNNKLKGV